MTESPNNSGQRTKLIDLFHDVALRILLVDDKVGSNGMKCEGHFCDFSNQDQIVKLPITSCDKEDCTSKECKLCTLKRLMDNGCESDGKRVLFDENNSEQHFYWNDVDIECYYCPTIVPDFIDNESVSVLDKFQIVFEPLNTQASGHVQIVGVHDIRTALLLLSRFKFDMLFFDYLLDKDKKDSETREFSRPFFDFLTCKFADKAQEEADKAKRLAEEIETVQKEVKWLSDVASIAQDLADKAKEEVDKAKEEAERAKKEKEEAERKVDQAKTAKESCEARNKKYLALERLRLDVLDNRGPVDKMWIMPITGFNQTFIQDIYTNQINLIDHRWNISNGADPITTPWQFLYHLNKFVELQLKSCVYQMEELLRFVRYTCEDLQNLIPRGKEDSEFYEFQSFMGAEYANFMRRYGNRHLIQRDAIIDNKKKEETNKSVFATYIWEKLYKSTEYRDVIELNRLIQRFLYHTSVMHKDRLGQQRLEETFGQLCFFIETNQRVKKCLNSEDLLSEGFDFHAELKIMWGLLDRLTKHSN